MAPVRDWWFTDAGSSWHQYTNMVVEPDFFLLLSLGVGELEAIRKIEARPKLLTAIRIDDRLGARYTDAGYLDACGTPLHVDFQLDGREDRGQDLGHGAGG
jgi:hypothetical protein